MLLFAGEESADLLGTHAIDSAIRDKAIRHNVFMLLMMRRERIDPPRVFMECGNFSPLSKELTSQRSPPPSLWLAGGALLERVRRKMGGGQAPED